MTAYVAQASTAWDVTTTWNPNGIPSSGDSVTIPAGFNVTIPSGYTASSLGVTLTGSSFGSRGILTIAGTLQLYGNSNQGTWCSLLFSGTGTLDLRGFSWLIDQTDATGVRNIVQNDNTGLTRIYSSTTKGHFGGADGGVAGGLLHLENFWISNTNFRFGANYYSGQEFYLKNGCFYNCGRIDWSDYQGDGDNFTLENVHFTGSQASEDQKVWLTCRSTGGTVTGTRSIKNVVFDYTGIANAIVRGRYWEPSMVVEGLYIVSAYFEGIAINCTITGLFSAKSGVVGEGGFPLTQSYVVPNLDNPHTLQNLCENVTDSVIENIQPIGSSDAGDHCIVSQSGSNTIRKTLLIDNWGGVMLNALGTPAKTGTYTLEHCTLVYDVHSADYGQLIRNENSGTFDPSSNVTIRSNLVHIRSNPSGTNDIRVFNLETAGDDQIETFDYNCLNGVGSNLNTIYYGVTSATKGAVKSQAGWGLNDKLNVPPDFIDQTRGIVKWAQQYGASDYNTAVNYLVNGVNGYDPVTHMLNSSLKTNKSISDLITYVRAGYAPTSQNLKNAGHDGVTIGAIEWSPVPISTTRRGAIALMLGLTLN